MSAEPTVFVIDDDVLAGNAVCGLVRSRGLQAEWFASAEEFLQADCETRAGCLVTDVRMLGMSGIELVEELAARGSTLPVIVLTAYAHTPLIVRAMQAGALTILDRPYRDAELWDAIRMGVERNREICEERKQCAEIRRRIASLSDMERAVMDLVVAGEPNKVIAVRLDVSVRTVEARRGRVFQKMQAASVAELVRTVMLAEGPAGVIRRADRPDSGMQQDRHETS